MGPHTRMHRLLLLLVSVPFLAGMSCHRVLRSAPLLDAYRAAGCGAGRVRDTSDQPLLTQLTAFSSTLQLLLLVGVTAQSGSRLRGYTRSAQEGRLQSAERAVPTPDVSE
jgi:hypothetical protein